MRLDLGNDFNNLTSSSDPLPKGEYELKVTGGEVRQTKNGNGVMLELTLKTSAGRQLKDFIVFKHTNEQAQSIGLQKLKDLQLSAKLPNLDDSDMLLNKTVTAYVTIENSDFGQRNRISNFVTGSNNNKAEPAPSWSSDADVPF